MSHLKKTRGFTLIELLIVIAIIAVLVTIGLASFTTVQKRARDSQRKSDLKSVQGALEQYYADNNEYPTQSGTNISCGSAIAWGTGVFTCNSNTYMKQLPKDPQSSTEYRYEACNSNQTYALYANLENPPSPPLSAPAGCNALPSGYNYVVSSQN